MSIWAANIEPGGLFKGEREGEGEKGGGGGGGGSSGSRRRRNIKKQC